MEYHFKTQLQFDNALRKNEQEIKAAREVDEHLFADKWLLVQARLNQATIYFDALLACNKGIPLKLNHELAISRIIASATEAEQLLNTDEKIHDFDFFTDRALAKAFQCKAFGARTDLQMAENFVTDEESKESFLDYQRKIKEIENNTNLLVAPIPTKKWTLPTGTTNSRFIPLAKQPPSPSTIEKSTLATIVNQYQTSSWFYFFFSCLGLNDKRSGTIVALCALINDPKTSNQITQQQIEKTIKSEKDPSIQRHRISLFNSRREKNNGTSTDEVLSKLRDEFPPRQFYA